MALDFAFIMSEDRLIDTLLHGDEEEDLPECYYEQQDEYRESEWLAEENPIVMLIAKHLCVYGNDALPFICTIKKNCELSLGAVLGDVIVGYCASPPANYDMLRTAISAWKKITGRKSLSGFFLFLALIEICTSGNAQAASAIVESSDFSCLTERQYFDLLFILCGNGCVSIAQQIMGRALHLKRNMFDYGYPRSSFLREINWSVLIKTARDHNFPSFVLFLEEQAREKSR